MFVIYDVISFSQHACLFSCSVSGKLCLDPVLIAKQMKYKKNKSYTLAVLLSAVKTQPSVLSIPCVHNSAGRYH